MRQAPTRRGAREGDITVPKYDVTTPDVKVGTTEKTIEVPKVTITTAREKEQGKL